MAVKTDFSEQQWREILSHYQLGEYKASQPIPPGNVQTNFFLQTTQGAFVLWNYGIELCRDLAHEAAQEVGTVHAEEKLEWVEQELAKLRLPKSLPKGICHGDFHFSNILFKDGAFQALLDFDDANYTFLMYDLATLIDPFLPSFDWDTWSRFQEDENVFDFREARKTVLEYSTYRPLSKNEKSHLFDVYKLTILFDCIWYFQRGEGHDFYEKRKIDALNRLGREQFYHELFV